MSKNKKAYALLEFLMTYGWAILVILIAISALFYISTLNVPDHQVDIDCLDRCLNKQPGRENVTGLLEELRANNQTIYMDEDGYLYYELEPDGSDDYKKLGLVEVSIK